MRDDAYRFLALNCILNGRSLVDAFDGDFERAAKVLGTPKVHEYNELFQHLEETKKVEEPLVRVLLNYMRLHCYAFVTPKGSDTVMLSSIVESDRAGEVSDILRRAIVLQLIRDVSYIDKLDDIGIRDGVFYLPKGITSDYFESVLMRAYNLFCFGPTGEPGDTLISKASSFTVAGYKPVTVAVARRLLSNLAKNNFAPSTYRETIFMIPDLFPVYQRCGCLLSNSDIRKDTIDWIMDNGEADSISISVDKDVISSLIVNDLTDLSNIEYAGKKEGIRVKAGN